MKTEKEIGEKLIQVNSDIVNYTEAYRFTKNKIERQTFRIILERLVTQRQVLNWILGNKAFMPVVNLRKK